MNRASICCMQNGQFVIGRKCPACPGFNPEGEPSALSDVINFPDEFANHSAADMADLCNPNEGCK